MQILVVPPGFISPRAFEAIPAYARVLRDLRGVSETVTFCWPHLSGAKSRASDWEGTVAVLRSAIGESSEGSFVVDVGPSGWNALLLLALSGDEGVAGYVAGGFYPPPPTLRSLELPGAADVYESIQASQQVRPTHQWLRWFMQGASEGEITKWAETIDADIEPDIVGDSWRSFFALDMTLHTPDVRAPTLFLNPVWLASEYWRDAFLRFVPHAEVEEMQSWPTTLHVAASGGEFSRRVMSFMSQRERQP
jgi:hypothetical protein